MDEDALHTLVLGHDTGHRRAFGQERNEGCLEIELAVAARIMLLGEKHVDITLVVEHANRLTILQALGAAGHGLLTPLAELEVTRDIPALAGDGDGFTALKHRLLLRCGRRRLRGSRPAPLA